MRLPPAAQASQSWVRRLPIARRSWRRQGAVARFPASSCTRIRAASTPRPSARVMSSPVQCEKALQAEQAASACPASPLYRPVLSAVQVVPPRSRPTASRGRDPASAAPALRPLLARHEEARQPDQLNQERPRFQGPTSDFRSSWGCCIVGVPNLGGIFDCSSRIQGRHGPRTPGEEQRTSELRAVGVVCRHTPQFPP